MTSNPSGSLAPSKSTISTTQLPSPFQAYTPSSNSGDGVPQRRNGTFSNINTSRNTMASARNLQSSRKQHKGQRRPRLTDEDATAENAAIRSTSSRKGQTSITHLMSFTLPPRPPQHYQQPYHGRNARHTPTWGLGSGYHAIDKAKFIHANYRFIVDPRGDYTVQAKDADRSLEWNSQILQILASAQSQSANCPICLSVPVAPRMARCGHIFCLPCLLRFMHSTDESATTPEKRNRWKNCPICWDTMFLVDVRPVRWFFGQEGESPHEGQDVVLRLMKRYAGSTIALPIDAADTLVETRDIPWFDIAEVIDYARVMKGGEDYMKSQFDMEIEDLQRQEREDELMFGEGSQWFRRAVASIKEATIRIGGIGNPPHERSKPEGPTSRKSGGRDPTVGGPDSTTSHSQETVDGSEPTLNFQAPTMTISTGTDIIGTKGNIPKSLLSDTGPNRRVHGPEDRTRTDAPYYFYQALLHYYLSPLDVRILKAAFGDYSTFPSAILPRVEKMSGGHVVDDDLRKRAKYLAHLPHGCEVGFLECDWTDTVSKEILDRFKTDLDRRRKKNQEKASREEKERARAEKEEEDKRWAAVRRKRPSMSKGKAIDSSERGEDQNDSVIVDHLSSLSFDASSSSPPWRSFQGSAFATLASPSTSPSAPRTVWGTTVIPPASPTLHPAAEDFDLGVDDGWLQGWEGDVLSEDHSIFEVAPQTTDEGSSQAASTMGMNKRKKQKKITLMTTTARRGA